MNKNNYTPQPIDTKDVVLPEELSELAEMIAKNVHEVWSEGRMKEGWTYGAGKARCKAGRASGRIPQEKQCGDPCQHGACRLD